MEGIIGGWEGEWEDEETSGIRLGVKVTNDANVGQREDSIHLFFVLFSLGNFNSIEAFVIIKKRLHAEWS